MKQRFKSGYRVQLASGGPVMTVLDYGTYGDREGYLCRWFSDSKGSKTELFSEAELKAYETPRALVRMVRMRRI